MFRQLADGLMESVVSKEMHLIHYQVDFVNQSCHDFLLPIQCVSENEYSYFITYQIGRKKTLVEYINEPGVEFRDIIFAMSQFMLGLVELEKSLLGANHIVINQEHIFFELDDERVKIYLGFLPIKPRDNIYACQIRKESKQVIINTLLLAHNALIRCDEYIMGDLYNYFGEEDLEYGMCHELCEAMDNNTSQPERIELKPSATLIEKKKEDTKKKIRKKRTYKIWHTAYDFIKCLKRDKKIQREMIFTHGLCLSSLVIVTGVMVGIGLKDIRIYCLAVVIFILTQVLMFINRVEGHNKLVKKRMIEIDSNTVYISKDYI